MKSYRDVSHHPRFTHPIHLEAIQVFWRKKAGSDIIGFAAQQIAPAPERGGLVGGIAGVAFGKALAARKRSLNLTFAGLVILVGLYVAVRGTATLFAA